MAVSDKLEATLRRFEEIDSLLANPQVTSDPDRLGKLAKERADLEPLVTVFRQFKATEAALTEARSLAESDDPELASLARDEIPVLTARFDQLEAQVRAALVPKDPNDEKNVIVEIRGGTGGEEAALFATDLYRMYLRFAQRRGLRTEVMDISETEQGGIKEVVFEVSGRGAYSLFKHEGGVHRVQRVPSTEAQGRIHTSTATVAIMPEAEEVDVHINPNDLRIDIFHSGGAGGQNVNKVATAVRMVHLPTGIVAVCQDERSQLKNRTKAMTILRSRLLERETRAQQEETAATRRSQVGSAERSEKVRTYNFPQDRLTDHRIGLTVHGLDRIMAGDLDEVISALQADEHARKLQEAVA
ncbi:MAG: peptide chain release factor 1 [SAR202 cluster bacterium]|nr:peptide chain release factor 1 [SAR202 cluster bacterium]